MDLTQAGLRYIGRGVAPVPIWRDKRKNPYLLSVTEFHSRLPSFQEWRRWANRWPNANVALITGYWRLCALDFDTEAAYQAWIAGPGWGIRGQTWTVATARGYHVWFEVSGDPGDSRSFTNGEHEVLLRARGGYAIVPPSVHHSGVAYRTVHKVEPRQVDSIDYYLEGWEPKIKSSKLSNLGGSGFAASADPGAPKNRDLISQNHYRIEKLIPIPEGSKPNGRGAYKVRCPFHDDQSPSAWLNVEEQRFGCNHCWPSQYWDVINVVAMLNNISNQEAFKQLKSASR